MSTLYVADGDIDFESVRGFDSGGVRGQEDDRKGSVALVDEAGNCLLVYAPTDGWPVTFEVCGQNDPRSIVAAIRRKLGVCLVSEYEDAFEKLRRKL